jgi:di/tricarboxylate transporter
VPDRDSLDQLTVAAALLLALVLFAWGRWRYDAVALGVLLALVLVGVVPAEGAFSGFGHPAVITVAAVLVVGRGLENSGVVDAIARQLLRAGSRPTAQVASSSGVVAVCSAFMNNVGALALLMPVAIRIARQSGNPRALLLMPLAFASLLGGMVTLIGTPPNIIIAT